MSLTRKMNEEKKSTKQQRQKNTNHNRNRHQRNKCFFNVTQVKSAYPNIHGKQELA